MSACSTVLMGASLTLIHFTSIRSSAMYFATIPIAAEFSVDAWAYDEI